MTTNVVTEDQEKRQPEIALPGREPKMRWYVRLLIRLKLAHTESQAIAEVILLCGLMIVASAFMLAWNEKEKRETPISIKYGAIDQTRFIPPPIGSIIAQ